MAELITPTIEQQPIVKGRGDAWAELGAQQYNNPSDIPVRKPQTGSNFDTVEKVGAFNALIKGVPSSRDSSFPYNPFYKPTTGEAISSALTQFARSGAAVISEWTPEYRAARASLDELRKTDPEAADQIEESTIGKKLSTGKLIIKGAAAAGEGILSVLPFFKFGRTALTAAEIGLLGKTGKALELAKEAATVSKVGATVGEAAIKGIAIETAGLASKLVAEEAASKLGTVGRAFVESPVLQRLYGGGLAGTVYSGLYGLHAYDADWEEAAKNAVMGGAFGVGLVGTGSALAFLGKYGGNKALQGFKFISPAVNAIDAKFLELLPAKWHSAIFSVESTMKRYYGDVGENFINMYRKASKLATMDLGRVQLGLIDAGLLEAPPGLGKAFKNVVYIGNDTERMLYYNQVLRGEGAYAKQAARTAAIEADKSLQYLDGLRKYYASTAKEAGVVEKLLDVDTYLPKHTPVVEMTSKTRRALGGAATQTEREAIYAANDPMVKEMVENSVFHGKKFNTLDEAYRTYYDYADVVNGGAHTPIGDNAMLQRMVKEGQAKTIEEARGKIISDLKNRKQTLTPLAGSLDFKREVDLPWYDPNPARVMPQYVFDASMRIEMAKSFGANDEILHKMIGSLKTDLNRGVTAIEAAKTFESFVRVITGQVLHAPAEEKASALLRALQVPKLAFAQIVNLGQSLNTLLASDFGATMHGLKTAFTDKGIRDSIERGVLTNSFIRQAFEYSSGGSGAADKFLKYSGFTYTEIFNRVVGSSAADMWTTTNLNKLLSDYGVSGKIKKPLPKLSVADEAYKSIKENGGVTVSLKGDMPKKGFAYAPLKNTEFSIPVEEFTQQHYSDFVDKNIVELSKPGNFVGGWTFEGRTYLDISRVGDASVATLDEAVKGKQLAVFDLELFKEIPLGKIENNIYTKIDETSNVFNKYRRENLPTDTGGGLGGVPEVPAGREGGAVSTDILTRIQKEQPREYWALKELGLPVEEIVARGHMLPEEKALAAQAFVEKTQFLGHPIGLPYFSSTPAGKVLFQFKTFAYQQARFITNEIKNTLPLLNQAGRKDVPRLVRNLLILGTIFPMTGEVLADIRSLITQEKRPTKFLDRYIADIFAAGTYGMFYDFYRSAESGRTAENILGATAGDAIRYFENLVQAPGQIMGGRGDTALKNFTKNILRQTGVGRIGVNVIYPQTKGRSTLQSLMDWSAD